MRKLFLVLLLASLPASAFEERPDGSVLITAEERAEIGMAIQSMQMHYAMLAAAHEELEVELAKAKEKSGCM